MTWTVIAVPREGVKTVWPVVAPLLAPAVEVSHGRMSMRSVLTWLLDGRYLLWVAHQEDLVVHAAFLTREAQYPERRVLTIDGCGGTQLDGWLEEADRVFRAHSRQAGLSGVELYGRPGWARALKQFGWQQSAVMVEVDFEGAA